MADRAAPGRPTLIALTILSFQGSWNEFLHPLIAVPNDQDLRTLPVGLALLRGAQGEALDYPVLLGASLLKTIPVASIYLHLPALLHPRRRGVRG